LFFTLGQPPPSLCSATNSTVRSARRPPNVDLRSDRAEAGWILLTSSSHDRAPMIRPISPSRSVRPLDFQQMMRRSVLTPQSLLQRGQQSHSSKHDYPGIFAGNAVLLGAAAALAATCAGGSHRDGAPLPEWMLRSQKGLHVGGRPSHDRCARF
jgi:hypothetical protein